MSQTGSANVTRREVLAIAGAMIVSGCAGVGSESAERGRLPSGPVDAGPVSSFATDGIYGMFSERSGFFIIREGGRLFAQSAICTHRFCKLTKAEAGFRCKCHGSTFTRDGHVTRGPARRDLPRFAIEQDSRGHLIVYPQRRLEAQQFEQPGAFLSV